MSLVAEILACPTPEQVLIYLSEMSEQELGEALDEVELVNAGNRWSKIKRLWNYVFRVEGLSGECFSDTSSNATRENSVDLSDIGGLSTHDLEGVLNEIPVSITAPVTVTASEFISSFPITTMAGTMSRIMPFGLALAYGYANISYTGPTDSFHLPDPIFPPMTPSRASTEMIEEDVRPSTRGVPPSEQQREPSFRDTVRGGLGKLYGERNFGPLVSPVAQHGTFDSTNADGLGLGGEGVPDATYERFGRAHSRPEVLGSRGGPVRDGRLDLHFNLDTNLETMNQTGIPDEHMREPNRADYDSEGGPNRFSRYEVDCRTLNLDGDPVRGTRDDQGPHN